MPEINSNNRIARNTLILYFRMLISMGIGLFTSRVLLQSLGQQDFGIFNLVGGIVLFFAFINTTLSGATSRFLTYELGKNDQDRLKRTFSSALTIHIGVALLILVLAETAGLWFLEHKLNIPPGRMDQARIVYQFAILSSMVTVTQVPFNATIIAHERMDVFAWVSMLDAVLKLLIVYLLLLDLSDRLTLYPILLFLETTSIALLYRAYCRHHYKEVGYRFRIDKDTLMPLLRFSGWDLYGNLCVVANIQGVNVLLNIFFGPVINAATALATQVRNAMSGFSGNFLTAMQPQIVKDYARGDKEGMLRLVVNASKYSFLLSFLLNFPLILENDFVMKLWLNDVPSHTVAFCQLSLIYSLVGALVSPLNIAIHATGKIKALSLVTGSLFLLTIPISYLILKSGFSAESVFQVNILFFVAALVSNIWIFKRLVPDFQVGAFLWKVLLPVSILILLTCPLPLYIHHVMAMGWGRLLLSGVSSVVVILLLSYFIILDKDARQIVKRKLTRMNREPNLS